MSKKNKGFIITNSTPVGDYTPSTTKTIEEAVDWLQECTINNYLAANGPVKIKDNEYDNYDDIKEDGLIEEMKKIINETEDCYINDKSSYIEYGDGSYNRMEIFKNK